MAADRYQAAADEGDVTSGVKQRHLTHRVAEEHTGPGATRLLLSPRDHFETHLLDHVRNNRESFGMPGNQHQQEVRIALKQSPVGAQNLLLLLIVCTRGDPDGPVTKVLLSKLGAAISQVRRQLDVELYVPGDPRAHGTCA